MNALPEELVYKILGHTIQRGTYGTILNVGGFATTTQVCQLWHRWAYHATKGPFSGIEEKFIRQICQEKSPWPLVTRLGKKIEGIIKTFFNFNNLATEECRENMQKYLALEPSSWLDCQEKTLLQCLLDARKEGHVISLDLIKGIINVNHTFFHNTALAISPLAYLFIGKSSAIHSSPDFSLANTLINMGATLPLKFPKKYLMPTSCQGTVINFLELFNFLNLKNDYCLWKEVSEHFIEVSCTEKSHIEKLKLQRIEILKNCVQKNDCTPLLLYALSTQDEPILKLFSLRSQEIRVTPQLLLAMAITCGYREIAKELITCGVKIQFCRASANCYVNEEAYLRVFLDRDAELLEGLINKEIYEFSHIKELFIFVMDRAQNNIKYLRAFVSSLLAYFPNIGPEECLFKLVSQILHVEIYRYIHPHLVIDIKKHLLKNFLHLLWPLLNEQFPNLQNSIKDPYAGLQGKTFLHLVAYECPWSLDIMVQNNMIPIYALETKDQQGISVNEEKLKGLMRLKYLECLNHPEGNAKLFENLIEENILPPTQLGGNEPIERSSFLHFTIHSIFHHPNRIDSFLEMTQLLLSIINPNTVDNKGNSALHLLARKFRPKYFPFIRLLLEAGADPFQKNREGLSPYEIIESSNGQNSEFCKSLMLVYRKSY